MNLNSKFNSNDCVSNYNSYCIPYEQNVDFDELAKAYVLFQKFCGILNPQDALIKGSAFQELYKPYTPIKRCKKTKMC